VFLQVIEYQSFLKSLGGRGVEKYVDRIREFLFRPFSAEMLFLCSLQKSSLFYENFFPR